MGNSGFGRLDGKVGATRRQAASGFSMMGLAELKLNTLCTWNSHICSELHDRWRVGEFGGEQITCVRMAECLRCSSEIITILLIGYTPIQHKKFFKKSNIQILGFLSAC